jgi:23S rRNA pseudouridine2605 synthase
MNKPRLIQIVKRSGIAETREEATALIKSGRVKVEGRIVTDIYYQVRPQKVTIDGKPVKLVEDKVYFIMNKPAKYSCQKKESPSVLDLVTVSDKKVQNMLFSVGRLDVDTTGLLIITNDGEILHKILQPEKNIWKTYHATVDKEISKEGIERIRKGITIQLDTVAYKCLPAQINRVHSQMYEIKIKEGKKRQVRRMLEAVGVKCLQLKRQAIGGLELPNIKEGEYKAVTKNDLMKIFKQ